MCDVEEVLKKHTKPRVGFVYGLSFQIYINMDKNHQSIFIIDQVVVTIIPRFCNFIGQLYIGIVTPLVWCWVLYEICIML